jgi:hypothetical protein
MEKAIIRPARDDDLETIKQIAVEAWEAVYQYLQKMMGDEVFVDIHG